MVSVINDTPVVSPSLVSAALIRDCLQQVAENY